MIGNNKLELNEASMLMIVNSWLVDTIKVVNLKATGISSNNDGTFNIKLETIVPEVPKNSS